MNTKIKVQKPGELYYLKIVFVLLILLSSFKPKMSATILSAASVMASDVQKAIDASFDGDVVIIPAGNAIWTNIVNINYKAISVIGAGIGVTVITNIQPCNLNDGNGGTFRILCTTNGMTRISNLEINGNQTANGITVHGQLWSSYRIDNCKFKYIYGQAIVNNGLLCGLIDNCIFEDNYKSFDNYGSSTAVQGINQMNYSWTNNLTLGTTNCVVIEDCTVLYKKWYQTNTTGGFKTAATSSSGLGGRTVIRYCKWTNSFDKGLSFFPIVDAHGNQHRVDTNIIYVVNGTNDHRGTRQYEFYNNLFVSYNPITKSTRLTHIRGGTCLLYNNYYIGQDFQKAIYCQEEDAPYYFNYRDTYPGNDQHWLYIKNNTVNGIQITNLAFANTNDSNFIITGTNVFYELPENYKSLEYPHPVRVQFASKQNKTIINPNNLRVK